jgi:hypothetical protein
MITAEKRRELLTELCDGSRVTANHIAQHCDTLFGQTDGPLTEEQIIYVSTIRKNVQRLLSRLDELEQTNCLETYLSMKPEEFEYFSLCLLQDLRNPLLIMLGYSATMLDGLNDRQQVTVREIQQHCQTLQSAFNGYRAEAVEESGDRP